MIQDQFSVYQVKPGREYRKYRFRSYESVVQEKLDIDIANYQLVYCSYLENDMTPETIRDKLDQKLPSNFKGHAVSVSDVIVMNRDGVTRSYYLDKQGYVLIHGFIRPGASSSLITLDTEGVLLENRKGSWIAVDELVIDGRQFFLMEHEQYGNSAAFAVVDANGKIAAEDTYNGFDESVISQIRQFMHPQVTEQLHNTLGQINPERKPLENWQKSYENGEYIRNIESGEEQNYSMIDGSRNNVKKGENADRTSIIGRLHEKQKLIYGKNESTSQNQNFDRTRK